MDELAFESALSGLASPSFASLLHDSNRYFIRVSSGCRVSKKLFVPWNMLLIDELLEQAPLRRGFNHQTVI